MSRYLYVCFVCRRQVDQIFHHAQEVPCSIPCPGCGSQITQFNVPRPEMVQAPSGVMKPKVAKGRRR